MWPAGLSACCPPWHSHSRACCQAPGPGSPSSGHRHKEKGDPTSVMGPQEWLIPRPRISWQALPRPAWVPVPRVRRDVVMQEARTGASGSSPSQLAPPPVAVHTNEEPHPIPRLVLPRRHLRVSGHGSKLGKGSAGRLGGAWSSIPTNTEQGVRRRRGVRGRGWEQGGL